MNNLFYDLFLALTLPIPFLAALKYIDDLFGPGEIGQHISIIFKKSNISPPFSKIYTLACELPEHIFGRKIISLRSLAASATITLFWLAILVIFMIFLQGNRSWLFNKGFLGLVSDKFIYFFIACLFIDYFSTCITRILFKIGLNKSINVKFFILFGSIATSMTMFYLLFSATKYYFTEGGFSDPTIISSWLNHPFELQTMLRLLNDAHFIPKEDGTVELINFNTKVVYAFPEGMIFISSMLTPIWILITIMAQLLYKYAVGGDAIKRFFQKYAALKSKPILTLAVFIYIYSIAPIWIIVIIIRTLVPLDQY